MIQPQTNENIRSMLEVLNLCPQECVTLGLCAPHMPKIVGGAAFMCGWMKDKVSEAVLRHRIRDIDVVVTSEFPREFLQSAWCPKFFQTLSVKHKVVPANKKFGLSYKVQVGRLEIFSLPIQSEEELLKFMERFPFSHQRVGLDLLTMTAVVHPTAEKALKDGVSDACQACFNPEDLLANGIQVPIGSLEGKAQRYMSYGLKFENFKKWTESAKPTESESMQKASQLSKNYAQVYENAQVVWAVQNQEN